MAKRLSEEKKIKIVAGFTLGKTIDQLAEEFTCTNITIIRNLKKNLGENKFKELTQKGKSQVIKSDLNKNNLSAQNNNSFQENFSSEFSNENFLNDKSKEESISMTPFVEITPLDYEIENIPQKDLSSIPISEIRFPNTVYMIVDKKIELETKFLKDYPNWQFLSNDELNRKTIEIFEDMKNAKRFCKKEQKVIKVPNTEVFRIVSRILIARGISRIISEDKLICL